MVDQLRSKITHRNVAGKSRRRGWMSYIPAGLLLLSMASLYQTVVLTLDNQQQMTIKNSMDSSLAVLPTKEDFQQIHNKIHNKASLEEGQFIYANRTFKYRYSTQLFSKTIGNSGAQAAASSPSLLPKLVFGVCANSKKPVRRQAIRKSWAQGALLVFFIVAGDWDDLEKEFYRSGDLLWIDTSEDYRNGLTPKTLGFVHFGSSQLDKRHHIPFDYIFKTDDDVYVNATQMSVELSETEPRAQYYGMYKNGTAPSRDKNANKWYLSREVYPDDCFPPYAPGVGYALSRTFANCASEKMESMLEMPWEDVATGILASQCEAPLTRANENWGHFLVNGTTSDLDLFPAKKFYNAGYHVNIYHKVAPWYFISLYKRESLKDALQYSKTKRQETRERRQAHVEEVAGQRKKTTMKNF